jgi:phycobilisome rod-core linker protein
MALPTLAYSPISQNHRVLGYEVGGDEQPRIYSAETMRSSSEKDALIHAAYRQIFHDQHLLECYRQPLLESQLRAGQITVKDFIRSLAASDAFRRLNYESNNNYRFAQLCIQRILGRDVFGDREKIAWSTVIATQGANAFIDALLSSEEYEHNFGDAIVPYQRRRVLPQRALGELPFVRMARYDQQARPDLATQVSADGMFDQDVGKGLFIAAFTVLAIASLVLAFGSAASL